MPPCELGGHQSQGVLTGAKRNVARDRGGMFDFIIAGAGSAGCVLAHRLTEDPGTRVLLLEAGPPDRKLEIAIPAAFAKLFGSKVDWAFQTEPEEGAGGRRLFFPRGRTLGGSSSTNGQMWVPGHRADLAAWEHLGWGPDDVVPWLERAAAVMAPEPQREGNPITDAFLAAAREHWPALDDLSGLDLDGAGPTQATIHRGRRRSAADAYLRPARRRRNLTVWTGAHVLRVLIAEGRAVGLEVQRGGRRSVVSAAREIILSAGAIGSPHLLMLSGIGPEAHLRAHGIEVAADVPAVGHNLQDHPITGVLARTRQPVTLKAADTPVQLARWLLARRGMLASIIGQAAAFVRTHPGPEPPDVELVFAPVLFVDEGRTPPPEHGFTIGPVVLKPRSRGTVSLRSSDPLVAPAIRPRYLTEPEDVRCMVDGIRLARSLLRTRALSPWVDEELAPGPEAANLEAWARGAVQGFYHPVGTCAIGAVVDPELRVRGIDALRVVDASVLPDVVRGHTNAITLAVAERAAEMIRAGTRVRWGGWPASSHPTSSSSPAVASSARRG
jgi:choline dehydrogenase